MAVTRGWKSFLRTVRALEETDDPTARLRAARAVAEQLEQLEHRLVEDARSTGLTWTEIGAVYGMSKQAAQQRFRRPRP